MGNTKSSKMPKVKRAATIDIHTINSGRNKHKHQQQHQLTSMDDNDTYMVNLKSPDKSIDNIFKSSLNKSKRNIGNGQKFSIFSFYNTNTNMPFISPKKPSMMSISSIHNTPKHGHGTFTNYNTNSPSKTDGNASFHAETLKKSINQTPKSMKSNNKNIPNIPSSSNQSGSISNNNNEGLIINGRFKLCQKIGKGSFGIAYESIDLMTNERVAIKLERKREDKKRRKKRANSRKSVNNREITILEKLSKCPRVPKLIWHGMHKSYHIMAIELQGMNLGDLYDLCDKEFSMKTIIYILIQCIKCMEAIHSFGIVHRDIKPQNFIINRDPNYNKLFVIDFGLSSWFADSFGNHIEYNNECSPVGTARYASINNHKGIHQTRRDDLESIGYMIVYFMQHELPWQGMKENDRVKKWRKIQLKKQSVSNEQLCHDLPTEFVKYLDIVKAMEYKQKPDYNKLINLFKRLYVRDGYFEADMKINNGIRGGVKQFEDSEDDSQSEHHLGSMAAMSVNNSESYIQIEHGKFGILTKEDALKHCDEWDIADVIVPDWIEVHGQK